MTRPCVVMGHIPADSRYPMLAGRSVYARVRSEADRIRWRLELQDAGAEPVTVPMPTPYALLAAYALVGVVVVGVATALAAAIAGDLVGQIIGSGAALSAGVTLLPAASAAEAEVTW